MTANNPLIEVCVEGIDGLLAAQAGRRSSFASSLVEGGITPSFGRVREALQLAEIPFHVIGGVGRELLPPYLSLECAPEGGH